MNLINLANAWVDDHMLLFLVIMFSILILGWAAGLKDLHEREYKP